MNEVYNGRFVTEFSVSMLKETIAQSNDHELSCTVGQRRLLTKKAPSGSLHCVIKLRKSNSQCLCDVFQKCHPDIFRTSPTCF